MRFIHRRKHRSAHHRLLLCFLLFPSCSAATEDVIDLPTLLDHDDVAYFFERRDLKSLKFFLDRVFEQSQRNPDPLQPVNPLPELLAARGGGNSYTTAYKVQHDLEQAEYLADTLIDEEADFFRNVVAPVYRDLLERIPPLNELERTQGLYPLTHIDKEKQVHTLYNKALHLTNFSELKDSKGNTIPLLNPKLDVDLIQRRWQGQVESNGQAGIIVVDNVLSPEALSTLQRIMWESTVWFQTKMPLKFGGYVGAYIDDGLNDAILLELALALHDRFPQIFQGHPLRYLWAYKYDSDYTGINLHADQAAVNVNIWLTPDEANLDPDSGGLVIYTAKPPADWDFKQYNTDTDFVRVRLLKPTDYANVTVPYRTNRAVIFDSALFHQTDHFHFRKGYKNRRINLTLLYGSMSVPTPQEQASKQEL